jgi:autotransporter-associated beta strand protein
LKNLPSTARFNSQGVNYDLDKSATIPDGTFDRIAYYMQLDGQFVEVSFDAAGFTNKASKIGIPNTISGEFYQQYVSNMNVTSNVAGVVNGTGITTGNVEFWPSNYGQTNAIGIPGASSASDNTGFDFGDGGAGTSAGHGSMQVHNYGAGQTIFAYNNWNNGGGEIGIGNRTGTGVAPDWTHAGNAGSYTTRQLYVFVHRTAPAAATAPITAPAAPAALVANAPELADYRLVYQKDLPTAVNYSTGPIAYEVDNTALVPYNSFDRVAYYLELDGNFVEVSFNADGFSNSARMLGIPNVASGENYQQYLANMNVTSNVAGVVNGTDITTGNIEFWSNNYQEANSGQNTGVPAAIPVPGSSGGTFDFGDRQSVGNHGSMQIHNYGARQTLFAYNNWNTTASNSALGIGNQPSGSPDWTFNTANIASVTTRRLYVLVRPREVGTNGNDAIVLKRVNGQVQYTVNGDGPVVVSDDTALVINGLDGADALTIDYAGGNPIPAGGLTFNGGNPTTASGDRLVIANASAANAIANLTHNFINGHDGQITLDGAVVNYTGLEPIDMTGSTVGNLVLNLVAGVNDQAVLEDDGTAGNGISRIRSLSGAFETTSFANPTASLTISANDGDTVSIAALDSLFATPVINLGGTGAANTFALSASNLLPDGTALAVAGAATFDLAGFNETIGSLSGNGAVNLGSGTLTTGGNNGSTTFSGLISGPGGSLVKTGGGTMTLTNAGNSYSGGTTLSGGVLQAGTYGNLGSGELRFNGGTLQFASGSAFDISTRTVTFQAGGATIDTNGNSVVFAGGIGNNGPGGLTKTGGGTLTLGGHNVYGGATVVSAGKLQLTPVIPADCVACYSFDNVSGTTINNDGSAGASKNAALYGTAAVAAGGHRGNGLSISGLSGGHLRVNQGPGSTGLSLSGGSWTASIWYKGLIAGGDWHTLYHAGVGDDYQTIINEGSRHLYSLWPQSNGDSGYTMPAGDTGWHMITSVGSGTGTAFYIDGVQVGVTTGNKSVSDIWSIGARGSDNLQQFANNLDDFYFYQRALSASEVLTLYAATQGASAASADTDGLPDTSALTVAAGAVFDLGGHIETIGPLSGPAGGSVTLGGGTLTVNSSDGVNPVNSTFAGQISQGGNLVKIGAGTLVLGGVNSYVGATTVTGGRLQSGAAGAVPASTFLTVGGSGAVFDLNGFNQQVSGLGDGGVGTGQITNGAAAATFTVNNAVANHFAGTLTGALSLVKTGAGTLTLAGHNTYTGATTVNAGKLQLEPDSANQPIAVTGWNQDIIIGASEGTPGYTASMAGWNYYERGLAGSTQGLPADSGATPRTFTSSYNSEVAFQFAPYTGNNAVYLDGPGNVTLTLATPARFEQLQFLETTRTMNWYVKLNFADGSSTTTSTWSDPDWTANPGPADRCLTNYGLRATAGNFYTSYLWMAERDVNLSAADQAKVLNSITIYTTSAAGQQLALFAVSGKPASTPSNTDYLPDTSPVAIAAGAILDVGGNIETVGPVSGPAGGAIKLGGGTLTINNSDGANPVDSTFGGVISGVGSLVKDGGGTLTLSGVNTYSGSTTIDAGTLRTGVSTGTGGVFANVPEAADYQLVYQLAIPNGCSFASSVPYSVNNAAVIPGGSFSRIGYYLELQQGTNPLQWVYVSFDAAPFATDASKLGVPNATSGELYHYDAAGLLPGQVRNMNVYSNVPALVGADRTGVTTGSVEFWSTNYAQANVYGVPGASGSTFDFGDQNTPGTYGSMQIHDYGLGRTLLAFNNWNGGGGELGIGNDPNTTRTSYNPDWTFTGNNLAGYTIKSLQIVVDARASGAIPSLSPVTIAAGATLDLAGNSATIGSLADGTGGGGAVVNSDAGQPLTLGLSCPSGSTTFSGTISDAGAANAIRLIKNGAGTQVLAGHNTYHGDTTVANGTLKLGVDNALPVGTALTLGASTTSGLLDLAGYSQTVAGLIAGASGATNKVVDTDGTSNTNTLTVNLAAGTQTFRGSLGNAADNTFALAKDGLGTLELAVSATYSGSTLINQGTLRLVAGLVSSNPRIMPLGDSITYGSGGTNAGYRGPLYSLLSGVDYDFQYVGSTNGNSGSLPTSPVNQTYHEGHGGWRTGDVSNGILHGVKTVADGGLGWLTVNPDLILLHIGTNNTGAAEAQSVIDVGGILDEIHTQRPTATTIVAQIIPKNGAAAWITQYNTDLASLVADKNALGYSVAIVDMNTNYPSGNLPDGVHPNDTGYAWMAQQWYNAIIASASFGSDILPVTTAVSIAAGATLDLNGVTQTVASLADHAGGGGSVINGASATPLTLTLNAPSGSASFSGTIGDNGTANAITLVKNGEGVQALAGNNSYRGATTVGDGTLLVNNTTGSGTGSGKVTVESGAALGGTGTISGSVENRGQVAPGALAPATGVLTTGSITFAAGASFDVDLNGPTLGSQYDQLRVVGTVDLGGATLSLSRGFAAAADTVFTIVNNTGSEAVAGVFAGLADESLINVDGIVFRIDYQGGDGNDVVLTRIGFALNNLLVDAGQAISGDDALRAAGTAPAVQADLQHSTITRIVVTVNGLLTTLDAGAFKLEQLGVGGGEVGLNVAPAINGSTTVVTLTFQPGTGVYRRAALLDQALSDGDFKLTIDATKIHDVDGNLMAGRVDNFFRFFGDSDGDRDVDGVDMNRLRRVMANDPGFVDYVAAFDHNGDGLGNATDYTPFRAHYAKKLRPAPGALQQGLLTRMLRAPLRRR